MILLLLFEFILLFKMECFAAIHKIRSFEKNNCSPVFLIFFFVFKSRDIKVGDMKAEFFNKSIAILFKQV